MHGGGPAQEGAYLWEWLERHERVPHIDRSYLNNLKLGVTLCIVVNQMTCEIWPLGFCWREVTGIMGLRLSNFACLSHSCESDRLILTSVPDHSFAKPTLVEN